MNTLKRITGFIIHSMHFAGKPVNILLDRLFDNLPTRHTVVLVTNNIYITPHNVKINSPHKL